MPFDFNLYSSLLLPAFIQGLLFSGLLIRRFVQESNLSDLLLAILLLFLITKLSFWMLGFAGWYDTHDVYTSVLFYFPFTTIILIGPTLYVYFRSLTNAHFVLAQTHWIHLILPLAWLSLIVGKFLVDFGLFYPFPDTGDYQYGTRGPYAELDKSYFVSAISYASFFYYSGLLLSEYKQYKRYVIQHFSTLEGIEFNWLFRMLVVVSSSVLLLLIFTIIDYVANGLSYDVIWYAYFGLGALVYYVSINGYFVQLPRLQQLDFVHTDTDEVPKGKVADLDVWKEKLETLMTSQKLYRQPDLTLVQLAGILQTNPTIVSKIINEGLNQNFNDYINKYRIQDVLDRVKAGEHRTKTLLGLAFDSGFNSKATFNRAFKKQLLKSPREYLTHPGNQASGTIN